MVSGRDRHPSTPRFSGPAPGRWARLLAYRASYFGMFDTGKAIMFPDAKNANVLMMWAFAQVVTVSAGVVSYPLDTVRRRLMMDSGRAEKMYNGTMNCF